MDFEDYAEPEVGIAVAVTAAVCSPVVRNTLRKGLVYGLAGFMMAGDSVKVFAKGVKKGLNGTNATAATAAAAPEALTAPAEEASHG